MSDMNCIECYNDDCIHWSNGKCRYYKTGNCVEIAHYKGMPICNSFEPEPYKGGERMNAYGGMYPFGEPDKSEEKNDTKTYENFDAWLKEHDAKVREDAIKEALTDVLNFYNDRTIDGIKTDAIDIIQMLTSKAEQMKEGKNE